MEDYLRFFLLLAGIGSVWGLLVLLIGGVTAKSAPQQAAVAAAAAASAIIPYVFARVVQLWSEANAREEQHKEILAMLRSIAEAPRNSKE